MDTIEYIIKQIDGDYAYLQNISEPDRKLKCVARALLPSEINEGTKLIYELFEYRIEY